MMDSEDSSQVDFRPLENPGQDSTLRLIDERSLWTEEIASLPDEVREDLPSDPDWKWAIYPWSQSAVVVPDRATTYAVLTSRNYPIVTRSEQAKLEGSHVVLAGLSTGRAVAQQLARLGIGSMHLVDGDHLAPSNTNRLVGTRLTDMGLSKVASTARELLEYNPYLKITTNVGFLDGPSLESHLSNEPTAVVIEMIDSLPAKLAIRRVAHEHSVPVVMPTDMDWDPMVDVDLPNAPMFGGRINDNDIAIIEDPTASFAEKTDVAMRLMSLEHWAPRSFLSGQLAKAGLISYWSQTAPSAATAAALVTRAVFDLVRGTPPVSTRALVSLRDAMGTADPIDVTESLYEMLTTLNGPIEMPS